MTGASTGGTRVRRWLQCLLLLAWAGMLPCLAAQVTVVLSEDAAPYRELATALRGNLSTAGNSDPVYIATLHEFESERASTDAPDTLFVTVGVRAARAVHAARPRSRMLATLIPRETFEAMFPASGGEEGGRLASAIWMDQPLGRQLDLLRLALPAARRVGVLLGPRSAVQQGELERQARDRDLRLVAETVAAMPALVAALSRLLGRCDVLLALPDEAVFNSGSAETILLMSYRKSVPLLAFSRAYVKAGALLALHTTPEQFGRQAAEIAAAVLQSAQRALPPPQPPRYFQVSWNRAVAQSLEIPPREEAELAQRLAGGNRP